MSDRIIAGIDVGTYQVKVVVVRISQSSKERAIPQIIGTGFAESRGLRNGYIINQSDVLRSIRSAVAQAEKVSGVTIKRAYLATSSVGLDEIKATGEVIPSRADSEITTFDIEKAQQDSEDRIVEHIPNRRILHTIPLVYRVDNEEVMGRPQGMHGTKLEVDSLFVTTYSKHVDELIGAVEKIGIYVDDVMASPLVTGYILLNKAQQRAGCILANIGAETVSIVVFDDMMPISVKVFPIGANDITNDIALGLKVSLEEAEKIKRQGVAGTIHPKKKLDDIINARLTDIFELIDAHLKKIRKDNMLPAGIVLTGGGSSTQGILDVAKQTLNLPARVATLELGKNTKTRDASWAVAYSLCIIGGSDSEDSASIGIVKQSKKTVLDWLSQFLP
jgi:cell division protein FtsA